MRLSASLFLIGMSLLCCAQTEVIDEIESALQKNEYTRAKQIVDRKINEFKNHKEADSLVEYIFITGKVYVAADGPESGDQIISEILSDIGSLTTNPGTLKQAHIEAGEYFGFTGNNKMGYAQNQKAFLYAEKANSTASQLALVQNNLSTFSSRTGNIQQAKVHSAKAISLLSHSSGDINYEVLYSAQNSIGAMMYYESKPDSAAFYFEEALESLKKAPPSPVNQYYRPAIITNNLSAIFKEEGQTTKAMNEIYQTIQYLEKFVLADEVPQNKKHSAAELRLEAIDNLAGIYKDVGDLTKAKELLEYSYLTKQKELPPDNPAVFKSQILLGQLYYTFRQNNLATEYLLKGIQNFGTIGYSDLFWTGDGYNYLALIAESEKDYNRAEQYYNFADSIYAMALGNAFDNIYLESLRNKAHFLAATQKYQQARKVADRTYNYVVENTGKESLTAFYQLLNYAAIEYIAENFSVSEKYANESLELLSKKMKQASSLADSVMLEVYRPKSLFYRARAQYSQLKPKTVTGIKLILSDLNKAIEIIERKKSYVNDPENNRIILSENKEVFDFIKQLELDLYQLTGDKGYIDRIMNLQESYLYTRIRSQLGGGTKNFAHVPEEIQEEERKLDSLLTNNLNVSINKKSLSQYIEASARMEEFKESIKTAYPEYYRLHYESFLSQQKAVEEFLDPGITLVRYFFTDTSLHVLVADHQHKDLISLRPNQLKEHIDRIYSQTGNPATVLSSLHELYKQLWQPIEKYITSKKVIVIPDGILFSLNMELLTPVKADSYKDLATKSLMAQHIFSYQYSILLLDKEKEKHNYKNSFIGYAPGFNDAAKRAYLSSTQDSVTMDFGYLKMLPQPFTTSLVKKLNQSFGGVVYMNSDCTKDKFMRNANNSRIIHVGTHAYSDNLFPEYSKLIFSKDKSGSSDNALFVSDIYNCSLSSELTILSACETGKPGYRDGEGMISLAHAFHYAGSQSILTSQWKVDEKAASIIIEAFYKNLTKGMDKDEALRLAKLDYIETEDGRPLSPAYWAGLIIIGDTSPIEISEKINYAWHAAIILLLAALYFAGYRYYKYSTQRKSAE